MCTEIYNDGKGLVIAISKDGTIQFHFDKPEAKGDVILTPGPYGLDISLNELESRAFIDLLPPRLRLFIDGPNGELIDIAEFSPDKTVITRNPYEKESEEVIYNLFSEEE